MGEEQRKEDKRKRKKKKTTKRRKTSHRNESFGVWSKKGQGRNLKRARAPRRDLRGRAPDLERDLRPHGSLSPREL